MKRHCQRGRERTKTKQCHSSEEKVGLQRENWKSFNGSRLRDYIRTEPSIRFRQEGGQNQP